MPILAQDLKKFGLDKTAEFIFRASISRCRRLDMEYAFLCLATILSLFFLLGCASTPAAPASYACPDGTKAIDAAHCAPQSAQPNSTPSQQTAPQINQEPIRAQYSPGEITRLCDASIAKLNGTLNSIASRPAGQRATSLLDFESAMADHYDEINPLVFMGYVSSDSGIAAEGTACEEKAGRYYSEVMTRKDIYSSVKESIPADAAQARLYRKTIAAFEYNGLGLPDEKLSVAREMMQNLTTLESKFSENLNLDNKTIEFTAAELDGAPQDFLNRLAKSADGKYIVTMKYPDNDAVMENVKNPETRRRMSVAFQNRGSPQENTRLLEEAIALRLKLANLLGYPSWADYQTSSRMAKNASTVDSFIVGMQPALANRSREDLARLLAFKKTLEPHATAVYPWDVPYLETQLMKSEYSLDIEQVREYFPLDSVFSGMFSLYSNLFNVSFDEVEGAKVWSPDVKLYRMADSATNSTLAYIYFDLFPRDGKYGHEAMFPLISGRAKNGSYVIPVTVIIANKNPPTNGKPALLTHSEVVDMFHEFGHAMHNSLSTVPYMSLSGTNVAWDYVETLSQTLQNWPWEPSIITKLSGHYLNSSQKMPDSMRDKIIATRSLDLGLTYAQRLAQSSIDMDYHSASPPADVNAAYNAKAENFTGMAPTPGNSFPATFGHLMGGYDGGYYSYMWSEVYALDVFSQFQNEGLENQPTGLRFKNTMLSQGDMKDGDALLRDFLGREPNSEAFFRMLNITKEK